MSVLMKVIPRGNVLYVAVGGDFTLDSAKRNFLEIVEAVNEHKSEKVLLDGRKIVGEPTIIQRFYYGQFVADAITAPDKKRGPVKLPEFAYVLMPPALDRGRLGETVAVNRGIKLKAFDNMPDALAWLGVTDLETEDPVEND